MASLTSPPESRNALILKELLGTGQFGSVHLAETSNGEARAVKRIPAKSMKTQKHIQNLDREIQILRESDHPNIVKLYSVKKKGDEFWLILEYCAGGDLAGFIKLQPKKKLSESVALHFFQQLTAGLLFMSKKDLIHRDLKPANLLLSANSSTSLLKIADFGFARQLDSDVMAQTQCGTPLYMAPEILSGQPHDAKADTYSAGTILFEMLCGKPPFTGRDVADLIANQKKELKMKVRVSDPCSEVIGKLLQRQPSRRVDALKLSQTVWVSQGALASLEQTAQTTSSSISSSSPHHSNDTIAAAAANVMAESNPNSPKVISSKNLIISEKIDKLETVSEESTLMNQSNNEIEKEDNNTNNIIHDQCLEDSGDDWEVVPTKTQMTAQVYLQRSHLVQKKLLYHQSSEEGENGNAVEMDDEEKFQAVNKVMEYSRKAAESFGAVNDPRVETVLAELQEFIQHPIVENILSNKKN